MEYAGRPASRESISLLPARGGFNPTVLFYSMYIQSKAFCFIFMPKVTIKYKNRYTVFKGIKNQFASPKTAIGRIQPVLISWLESSLIPH